MPDYVTKRRRQGAPKRDDRSTHEQWLEAGEFYLDGYSMTALADYYDCSVSTLSDWLDKAGVVRRRRSEKSPMGTARPSKRVGSATA